MEREAPLKSKFIIFSLISFTHLVIIGSFEFKDCSNFDWIYRHFVSVHSETVLGRHFFNRKRCNYLLNVFFQLIW